MANAIRAGEATPRPPAGWPTPDLTETAALPRSASLRILADVLAAVSAALRRIADAEVRR